MHYEYSYFAGAKYEKGGMIYREITVTRPQWSNCEKDISMTIIARKEESFWEYVSVSRNK